MEVDGRPVAVLLRELTDIPPTCNRIFSRDRTAIPSMPGGDMIAGLLSRGSHSPLPLPPKMRVCSCSLGRVLGFVV